MNGATKRGIARQASLWAVVLGASLGMGVSSKAVELADGTTHFEQLPRLEGASTTVNSARAWGAVYYFTLTIPEGAGEPLQRVVVAQSEGVDQVDFNLPRTRAYADTRRRQPLEIAAVDVDESGAVHVIFDPPVAAGETLMLGLRPYRNPRIGGVYLFGVTVFPAGNRPQDQFLGFGRLHFYDNHHRGLFR